MSEFSLIIIMNMFQFILFTRLNTAVGPIRVTLCASMILV